MCINRNIVECKVLFVAKYYLQETVLIETLWNVKYNNIRAYDVDVCVLIETLWNVKWSAP